jgi:uroporphyrinogen-III decarboxylase
MTARQRGNAMRFELKIEYSTGHMEASRRRMEARTQFRIVDRVPVGYCIVARYFAPLFGLRYLDYFTDAETQYRWQLEFARYRIERIPEDACTEPVVTVHPYFDNVIPPSAQGAEIGWVEGGPPRAQPVIRSIEDMERFAVARPDAGLRGTAIAWWRRMKELAAETRVTFGGTEGRVEVGPLSLGGLSPHMIAIDLVGQDFYWWMIEYPEACHRFLAKITQGEIEAEEMTRQVDPRPRGEFFGLAEDSAQVVSADMFREFCVPHTGAMFDRFGAGLRFGRGIHMCGDSRHLLETLKRDLRMTHFDIFGYPVPPRVAAEKLGGTTLLWGNINPMLMRDGNSAEVRRAARECLAAMAPRGGLLLGDGANVCPGTPLESFQAIMDAAEEYGTGPRVG